MPVCGGKVSVCVCVEGGQVLVCVEGGAGGCLCGRRVIVRLKDEKSLYARRGLRVGFVFDVNRVIMFFVCAC